MLYAIGASLLDCCVPLLGDTRITLVCNSGTYTMQTSAHNGMIIIDGRCERLFSRSISGLDSQLSTEKWTGLEYAAPFHRVTVSGLL